MPHLFMPDVFWTDVALGSAALGCGQILYRRNQIASTVFLAAAVSAWFAALSHGFFGGGTISPLSKTVWALVLTCIAVSSAALVQLSLHQPHPASWLLATFVAYVAFVVFVSDDIIWAAILQSAAAVTYGVSLLRHKLSASRQLPFLAPAGFAAYVACTALGAFIAVPGDANSLPLNPLAVFHIIEIPAVILLFISVRARLRT